MDDDLPQKGFTGTLTRWLIRQQRDADFRQNTAMFWLLTLMLWNAIVWPYAIVSDKWWSIPVMSLLSGGYTLALLARAAHWNRVSNEIIATRNVIDRMGTS